MSRRTLPTRGALTLISTTRRLHRGRVTSCDPRALCPQPMAVNRSIRPLLPDQKGLRLSLGSDEGRKVDADNLILIRKSRKFCAVPSSADLRLQNRRLKFLPATKTLKSLARSFQERLAVISRSNPALDIQKIHKIPCNTRPPPPCFEKRHLLAEFVNLRNVLIITSITSFNKALKYVNLFIPTHNRLGSVPIVIKQYNKPQKERIGFGLAGGAAKKQLPDSGKASRH